MFLGDYMDENKKIYKTLMFLQSQKEFLNDQLDLGIMELDCVRKELHMITEKERKLKEKLVLTNHITEDGEARSISHHEPTTGNPKDYYSTKMPDGRKIKATTYDGLVDKLFYFYTNGMKDYSLESVFRAALYEKQITENPNPQTVYHYEADFNRYISQDMARRDIRGITDIVLKQYTQEWVNRDHPKQKMFFSYKGILNLIFGYAFAHRIISSNPAVLVKNKPYLKSCDTRKSKPEEKILSAEEIDEIRREVRRRMTLKKWGEYYINGFAVLFAIETGVRVGELCALKWTDVKENVIHIHAQQLTRRENEKKIYYYDTHTKNEKGISQDGREFPLTRKILNLLNEIRGLQKELGIHSEFIFCHEDGEWIKTDAYETFLRRLCQSKGFKVTNNHALRMSLNSNVLLPMGISVADRAAMLGHSIQTNLQFYSFAQKDYVENVRNLLDLHYENEQGTPREPLKLIDFSKEKRSRMPINQAF